jgi:PmbA protein
MDPNQVIDNIESLLKRHPLDGYEIFMSSSRNLNIEAKDGKVDTFKCSAPVGVGLRVLKSGVLGFSFSTSLDAPDLALMVHNAMTSARFQTADELNAFPLPDGYPIITGLFDDGLSSVKETDKIEMAMELEKIALASDSRVKKVRKAVYSESNYEGFIRNSHGVSGSFRDTSFTCSVTAIAAEGDDSQMGWDFGFSNTFSGIDVEKIAKKAAQRAASLIGARKIPTMHCPAVLENHVATDILEVLSPSFLADNIRKGKSLLAGRMGEEIFSPELRIRDDGTLPGGMSTAPFDGEGVPQQNTLLVDKGRLVGFLYDTYHARRSGTSSTGNAVRSNSKNPPVMGVSNFFIENGTLPFDELMKGIGRGVLITSVMGMHTANPISGDFSVGAAGFLIENGKVTIPVKGIAIAGNILDLFKGVEAVGNDLRFFGAAGSPSLRISALDVSGD